jgi:hypothetical protein
MASKQTAVQWYATERDYIRNIMFEGGITKTQYLNKLDYILEKAKEIEKEQIEDAFDKGFIDAWDDAVSGDEPIYGTSENYYNQTFKTKQS